MPQHLKISGIILSSGFSTRMGSFKPLLQYKGNAFCIQIIRKLESVCSSVRIVTGFNSTLLIEELKKQNILSKGKVEYLYNPDYELGMFTSLQTGLRHLYHSDWVIVHMVDQPDLPEKFYSDFINNIDDHFDWIQPVFNLRKGHPIAIRSNLFDKILNASNESSLRTIFVQGERKIKLWECNYQQVLSDIDTPEDYKSLINRPEAV